MTTERYNLLDARIRQIADFARSVAFGSRSAAERRSSIPARLDWLGVWLRSGLTVEFLLTMGQFNSALTWYNAMAVADLGVYRAQSALRGADRPCGRAGQGP
jgi:hypothetical protein